MNRQPANLGGLGDFDFQLAPHLTHFVPLLGDELLGVLDTMPDHLSHQFAMDFRRYLWGMRRSWEWHFGTLFELHLYTLSLERTLRDWHQLHPRPAPGSTPLPDLSRDDISFLHFLSLDFQGRFDATCESISWHFMRVHIPAFAILLSPAVSQRLRE